MARNHEKLQLTLNRWTRYQQYKELLTTEAPSKRKKRPRWRKPTNRPPDEIPDLAEAEKTRRGYINEIQQLLAKICNPLLSTKDMRDINNKLNQKMDEKRELEATILKMGGPNYSVLESEITNDYECGPDGKLYFGAARALIGNEKRQIMNAGKLSFMGRNSLKDAIVAGLSKKKKRRGGKLSNSAPKRAKMGMTVNSVDPGFDEEDQSVSIPSNPEEDLGEHVQTKTLTYRTQPDRKPREETKVDIKPPLPQVEITGEEVFGVKDDFSARSFPALHTYRPEVIVDKSAVTKNIVPKPLEDRPIPKDFLSARYEKQSTTFEEAIKSTKKEEKLISPNKEAEPKSCLVTESDALKSLAALDWDF